MKESNVRNLTKTLAVLSLLAPASALPLGIGGIKLHSALNQNLNAEISLVLSQGEKVSDIKVHLAPPDKFDEAGVPWSSFLSKIRFEPVIRPDGAVVIRLSSREALKEPFLGLLLEVSWPKGSLYREFSVLVDPPEVYEQPTVPVIKLPDQLSTAPAISSEPRTEARPAQTRPVQSSVRRSEAAQGKYGPTSRKDTLWKISEPASRHRKVSVEQMMIAIYQDNPDAFFKENINALRVGKTLTIPEREAIVKISRKQALAEYKRHSEAWKNRSAPAPIDIPAPVVKQQPDNDHQVVENQLNLEAPSEASVLENAVIKPGQEQGTASAKPQVSSPSGDSDQTEAAGRTNDLQHKVLEMQQQLSKMQEMIALRDQQLAALQQAETQSVSPAPAQVPAQPAVPSFVQTSPQTIAPAPVQASGQPAEQNAQAAAQQMVQPAAPAAAQPAAKPDKVKPVVKPQKPILQQEMESAPDPFYMMMGTLGLGFLAGLGWLWWRKRRIDAKTDTESMFAPTIISKPVQDSVQTQAVHAAPQLSEDTGLYNVEPVGESSFLSEFTPSDFDAFDTDQGEIDPVSEADVYLAYGRYQQAEELMRQAIIEQPDRDECKLKLLEIFYANENQQAFEAYADELAASGKKTDKGFWDKVSEMGNEICPDSALFSSRRNGVVAQEEEHPRVSFAKKLDDAVPEFDTIDLLELGDASFDTFSEGGSLLASTESDKGDFDFDLSLSGSEERFDANDEPRKNETMEFDLDSLLSFSDSESLPQHADEKPEEILFKSDETKKDFDLELFDFDLEKGSSAKKESGGALDFTTSSENSDHQDILSLDGDFNFDFDLSGEDEEEPLDISGVSDLTDMDEFETKLDLARAYMDMGDEASAKEIVVQVLEKGSDDQKKVAQRIIDHLA